MGRPEIHISGGFVVPSILGNINTTKWIPCTTVLGFLRKQ